MPSSKEKRIAATPIESAGRTSGRAIERSRSKPRWPSPERAEQVAVGRSAHKRAAILSAATDVFLKGGYLGTNVDAIAAGSGVSKQTVYKHFGSKEALFIEIVASMTSDAGDLVVAETPDLNDSADLAAYLRTYADKQLTVVLTPRLMQLRRLVIGEVSRFPDLAKVRRRARIPRRLRYAGALTALSVCRQAVCDWRKPCWRAFVLFHVASHLEYAAKFPSTLILNIHAQRSASQVILDEQFSVKPRVKVAEFTAEGTGNRFLRLETGRHRKLTVDYSASVECDFQTYRAGAVEPTPIADLSAASIPYLFPSRYCQSDRLSRLAWDLFGRIDNPHQKVVAISDWIHENVEYLRGSTTSVTSAYDTVTQRTGVCRDFSHLAIALCRALNIPARYFSGYAYELDPPDFHACFECLIGGSWTVFDATRLAHLNGLVRIGTGRDAADAAIASIFGSVTCTKVEVSCELAKGQKFQPINRQQLQRGGVALEPQT